MKRHASGKTFLLFALACGIFLGGFQVPAARAQRLSPGKINNKVYFQADPQENDRLEAVERRVKRTRRVADAALRELFKGVNDEERKRGLDSDYTRETAYVSRSPGCDHETIKPLLAYYIGVSIKKGVATVNFRARGGCYLETTIFASARVIIPIVATLKQFKSIKEVQFALDGKVITEWDA